MRCCAVILLSIIAIASSPSDAAVIGFFSHEDGQTCDVDIEPYVSVDIYLLISWWPFEFQEGVTGASFGTANLPENLGYPTGFINEYWNSDNHWGDLHTEFSIFFDEPVGVGERYATLGRLEFLMFDPTWIGSHHQIIIVAGEDCWCLDVYDDIGNPVSVDGGWFTFNCNGDPCEYDCFPPPTPAREDSWSTVKALF
jgi:hypothetical protein